MLKIGDTVKVKDLSSLRKITNIGFKKSVTLKNGLVFIPTMLNFAGQSGVITDIAEPSENNQLTSKTYRIGALELYWSDDLLEDC